MEDRDEIIRRQMDEISKLINQNLMNLSESLWGGKQSYEKPVEEKVQDNIVPFPINRRS